MAHKVHFLPPHFPLGLFLSIFDLLHELLMSYAVLTRLDIHLGHLLEQLSFIQPTSNTSASFRELVQPLAVNLALFVTIV